jgi:hypothetical protein
MDLPGQWQKYPEPRGTLREGSYPDGYAARGKPGVQAHDAVQSFRSQNSELDCHAGVQLTVLDAADAVLGATRFNALHPVRAWPNLPPQDDGRPSEHALAGLGVPLLRDAEMNEPQFWFGSHVIELSDYTSLARHLVRRPLPSADRLSQPGLAGPRQQRVRRPDQGRRHGARRLGLYNERARLRQAGGRRQRRRECVLHQ